MVNHGSNWVGYIDVQVKEHIYEEPIRDGNSTSYSCWDFEKTPYYPWLIDNVTYKWDWDFCGVEDENGYISCRIQFENAQDLMAFKLTWFEEK
jgi:hypothetical protein